MRNAGWQYGLQLIKYVFPFITLPYLTRVLDPNGYAIYAYVLTMMGIMQIVLDFGFNLSGTKQIIDASTTRECGQILWAINVARGMLSLIVFILVVAFVQFVDILKHNFLYVVIAYIATCGRSLAPDFLFQGKENLRPLTSRFFVAKGFSTILIFVLVKTAEDILWIPILDVVSSGIALLWSYAAAKKLFDIVPHRASFREVIREFKTSASYCLSNTASALFTSSLTLALGLVTDDLTLIAYWSLAATIISAATQLYAPITNSLYPHMLATKDFAFARRVFVFALPVVVLAGLALALFSNQIIALIGGDSYIAGSQILVYISPILPLAFYSTMFGWPILGAVGKAKEIAISTIVSACVCLAAIVIIVAMDCLTIITMCILRCSVEGLLLTIRFIMCRNYVNSSA